MSYLSVSQTAEKWGISTRRIQILCGEGRIPGAMRIDEFWAIQMMLQNQQTRESRTERISRGPLKTKNEPQVITAILTRNQLIHKGPWVRILPSPSRKKPLLSTRTREVFSCF